ncbi:MAG TPA: hypothetical protein VII44_03430 [Puia sp.]
MLSLELSVNVVALLTMMAMSGLAGFALRSRQIVKIRAKLYKVENEMLRSHAEILELQKEYLSMEQNLRSNKNPVIVMSNSSHTESDEKLPNAALRKKLLTNNLTPTHIKAIS